MALLFLPPRPATVVTLGGICFDLYKRGVGVRLGVSDCAVSLFLAICIHFSNKVIILLKIQNKFIVDLIAQAFLPCGLWPGPQP